MPRLVARRAVVLRHVAEGVKGQTVLTVDAVRHNVRHHRQVQSEAALQREAQHVRGQTEVRAGRDRVQERARAELAHRDKPHLLPPPCAARRRMHLPPGRMVNRRGVSALSVL